jgi:hypothetical protein
MGAGGPGAVIEVTGNWLFVVMMVIVTVLMHMCASMHMGMAVCAAVAMVMVVRMSGRRHAVMSMGMIVVRRMIVTMGMHGAVLVDVRVFVPPLNLRFTCATAANCTHRPVSCSN